MSDVLDLARRIRSGGNLTDQLQGWAEEVCAKADAKTPTKGGG